MVYHFAAYAAEGLSPFIRKYNYENNLIASTNLITKSIQYDVKRFVFASSMSVYGDKYEPPFDEELQHAARQQLTAKIVNASSNMIQINKT